MLGTNPWFKKPWRIGEKVDCFGVFFEAGSVEKLRKEVTSEYASKLTPLFIVGNG